MGDGLFGAERVGAARAGIPSSARRGVGWRCKLISSFLEYPECSLWFVCGSIVVLSDRWPWQGNHCMIDWIRLWEWWSWRQWWGRSPWWAAKWSDVGVQLLEPLFQPLDSCPESPVRELFPLPEAVCPVDDAPQFIEVGLHGLEFVLQDSVFC